MDVTPLSLNNARLPSAAADGMHQGRPRCLRCHPPDSIGRVGDSGSMGSRQRHEERDVTTQLVVAGALSETRVVTQSRRVDGC